MLPFVNCYQLYYYILSEHNLFVLILAQKKDFCSAWPRLKLNTKIGLHTLHTPTLCLIFLWGYMLKIYSQNVWVIFQVIQFSGYKLPKIVPYSYVGPNEKFLSNFVQFVSYFCRSKSKNKIRGRKKRKIAANYLFSIQQR